MLIKRKNLAVWIAVGIAITMSIVFMSEKSLLTSAFSVTAEDTKPIQQHYADVIYSCSESMEINETYKKCVISSSNATGIGNLPSPFFKYSEGGRVAGPFGEPTPRYILVEPITPLLSQDQVEKVIDVIRSDSQIKSESFAWKVYEMDFYPMNYSWYDDVQLVIHGIRDSSERLSCGWYSTVTIDLNTLTIVKKNNADVISYEKC
ncbi:MAG: hypothetical protein WA799_06050 [Nitrosotalea sp.]